MMSRSLAKLWLFHLLALLLSGSVAQASPLSLGLVFSGGSNWNTSASSTYQFTLTAMNASTGSAITTLNAWAVGLQIFEHGAAPGTSNAITYSSLVNPTSNPMLSNADVPEITPATLSTATTATGLTGYNQLSIANIDATQETVALGQTKNLGLVTITSQTLASINNKTFDVYAVNNNVSTAQASAWQDITGTDTSWGGLDIIPSGPSLLLGTFTVSVPEPGSLLLATMSGLGMFGYFLRRRASTAALATITLRKGSGSLSVHDPDAAAVPGVAMR
jgi:PEP-CTERM motif